MPADSTMEYLKDEPFIAAGLFPEREALSTWFQDWLDNKEMFSRPYE